MINKIKIQRFNESNNENWTDQKFRQHIKDEDYLYDMLTKYLIFKKEGVLWM